MLLRPRLPIKIELPSLQLSRITQGAQRCRVGTNRNLSTLLDGSRQAEVIRVPCRSNGHVEVELHRPLVKEDPASPVIIYLPIGPIFSGSNSNLTADNDRRVVESLIAGSNATVIKVNYRLGSGTTYPTPIHDVVTAFDWVKAQVTSRDNNAIGKKTMKLGVCGQFIGGSLATMLALTENKSSEVRTAALAVSNPTVDWILPEMSSHESSGDAKGVVDGDEQGEIMEDENDLENMRDAASKLNPTKAKKGKRSKPPTSWESFADRTPLTTASLLRTRQTILRNSAATFDPFISPILFFRSPGAALPAAFPKMSTAEDASYSLEDDLQTLDISRSDPYMPNQTMFRKVHRQFPPRRSNLTIPRTLIMLHGETVLLDQGLELATLMRRSVSRDMLRDLAVEQGHDSSGARGGERSSGDEARDDPAKTEAEKRVVVGISKGREQGLWGLENDSAWRRDVEGLGGWLREALTGGGNGRQSKL